MKTEEVVERSGTRQEWAKDSGGSEEALDGSMKWKLLLGEIWQ